MSEQTKMTVKIHSLLWESFDAQISRLPVKRNQFLNNVIRIETPRLAKAMAGKRLSGKAHGWISSELNRLRPKTVSIDVEKEVVHALTRVVDDTRMVRDAFFNRLIAFLRSSDSLLDYFQLPRIENGQVGKTYGSDIAKPVSPLSTLESTFDDPLWYLHMAIKEIHQTSLYLLDFPSPKMDGFACWMADDVVPGTRANRRWQREVDEIARSLGDFELDAFTPAKPG